MHRRCLYVCRVAGGLVFGHGANALWMGSPDQIKDKSSSSHRWHKFNQHSDCEVDSSTDLEKWKEDLVI